jgi:sulfopyruvate decarboxylase subunit alpha
MTSTTAPALATGIDGRELAAAIRALGVTHVVCVPDTVQRSAIAALAALETPKLVYVCTEDEAMGINAGLYITGNRPMLLIQNNGLYACLNTLKGIALDAQVPTFLLIGQFGRDPKLSVEANPKRMVHRLEPTLDVWGVPHVRLDGPGDLPKLRTAWDRAWSTFGPSAALVGTQTT